MCAACSVVVTLLAVCAAAPVDATQQVLTLFDTPFHDQQRLDRAVPVATVSHVTDIVALGDARIVRNPPPDEPFVLGTATLDVTNPSHPWIRFTMTNTTPQPIKLSDVFIEAATMALDKGYVRYLGTLEGSAGSTSVGEQLQAGATITVEMPIPPMSFSASDLDKKYGQTWGFLVLVGEFPGLASWTRNGKVLDKAFAMLMSETRR